MPRYFIDFDDGCSHHHDDEGSNLRNVEQAHIEAKALLSQVARERLPSGDRHAFEVTVRAEDGAALYHARLTFKGRRLQGHDGR